MKKKYYAVSKGFKPGIYEKWYGPEGAEIQVRGFSNPIFKGFESAEQARRWLNCPTADARAYPGAAPMNLPAAPGIDDTGGTADITVYTDGGALGNPGPGGYAAVVREGGKISEISGGYRMTTNNRMELMACIMALESIKTGGSVLLYSDSKYVVDAMEKGWAKKWRANNWMRNKSEPAKNSDLWERLLGLCRQRSIKFSWVKGHANNPGNDRCDDLVKKAAQRRPLPVDEVFEKENSPR
ncbi:MAG: ribonuclease HI [Desulfobacterales bacterium]|nr:ribonuclease HI [Desulfobacterales bacterium]